MIFLRLLHECVELPFCWRPLQFAHSAQLLSEVRANCCVDQFCAIYAGFRAPILQYLVLLTSFDADYIPVLPSKIASAAAVISLWSFRLPYQVQWNRVDSSFQWHCCTHQSDVFLCAGCLGQLRIFKGFIGADGKTNVDYVGTCRSVAACDAPGSARLQRVLRLDPGVVFNAQQVLRFSRPAPKNARIASRAGFNALIVLVHIFRKLCDFDWILFRGFVSVSTYCSRNLSRKAPVLIKS